MAYSTFEKILYSFIKGLLFLAISNPAAYSLTNSVFTGTVRSNNPTCPSPAGHFIHTGIFFILIAIMMLVINIIKKDKLPILLVFKYTLYASLVFYIISNVELYQIMNNLVGDQIASRDGCPTLAGLGLHTIVFMIMIFFVMVLPRDDIKTGIRIPIPEFKLKTYNI